MLMRFLFIILIPIMVGFAVRGLAANLLDKTRLRGFHGVRGDNRAKVATLRQDPKTGIYRVDDQN
ncbi:MAG: hypothetical protein V6Z86_07560 [Hyphomicrobiales bacterium]